MSATKFLIPDVLADPQIEDPYPTLPVALCVEILSLEDQLSAAFAKCEEYHAWGVPYCWVIDPIKQTAWEYHAIGDPARIEQGGTVRAGTVVLFLEEIFFEQAK